MPHNDLKETILNEIATGATPQQCADKYNISAGTIRSWVSRMKRNVAEKKHATKNATQRKNATPKKATKKPKEPVIKLEDVDEELTEKQRLFCLYYMRDPVAGTAAKKAGYSDKCAYELGYQLLQNPSVRKEIDRLKKIKYESIMFGPEDLVEKHMRIAFSNITDFADFGQIEVPVMGPFGPIVIKNDETGEKTTITKIVNSLRFKESSEVDGGIIQEVKVGKDGASIKVYDAQKSMEWLERYFELNPMDRHKKHYDEERLKLQQLELQQKGKTGAAFEEALKNAQIQIQSLANLINTPQPDRHVEDFEEENE